jgi:hypothetical protein
MSLLKRADWIPIAIDLRASPATVTWLEVGETAFAEPFFQQTVERLYADNPGARGLTTGLEELLAAEAGAGDAEGARAHSPEGWVAGPGPGRREPAGFIFHMSRCGSTDVRRSLHPRGEHPPCTADEDSPTGCRTFPYADGCLISAIQPPPTRGSRSGSTPLASLAALHQEFGGASRSG